MKVYRKVRTPGIRRYWRETPRLAKGAFIVAAVAGAYFVLFFGYGMVMSLVTGGGNPPPGHDNPPMIIGLAMGLVSVLMALVMGLVPLVVIALALRSKSLTFKRMGVGLAALIVVIGLGFGISTAVTTDWFQHAPAQTGLGALVGEAGQEPTVWGALAALGFAYLPIVFLGARDVFGMGHRRPPKLVAG